MQQDLTLILGPMKSGKSYELISHFAPLQYTDIPNAVFQPARNIRDETIWSRSGVTFAAEKITSLDKIIDRGLKVIGIDEVHMFPAKEAEAVQKLLEQGTSIFICGLDMDYRGKMYDIVKRLLELAPQEVRYKRAVCEVCRQPEAVYTQIVKGKRPVTEGLPPVIPEDGTYSYFPVCRTCHVRAA